jgi:hypothetical protein
MKVRILCCIALVTATQGVAQSAEITPEERAQAEIKIQNAGRYLAQTMRDPASASFRNVYLYKRVSAKPGSQVTVCGEVNGRNGYGGLTGFQQFLLSGDSVYVGKMLRFDVSHLCQNNNPVVDGRDYSPEIRAAFNSALATAGGQ